MLSNRNSWNWIEKRANAIFYTMLATSGLLYICLDPQYRTGYLNDDALYVIRAREFANNISFHSSLIRPDFPLPGLPLLLTPLVKLVGPHWTSFERLSILITLLSVFLLWKWVGQWLSKGEALAIATLYAFNPIVARFSGIIMPAPYCAFAAILSFALLSHLLEAPSWKIAIALGLVVGWGSLLRPESILILIGVLPALLLNRNGRSALRAVSLPLALWLVFFLVTTHSRANLQTEYGSDLGALAQYWSHSLVDGMGFAGYLLRVFMINTMSALSLSLTPAWMYLITAMILFYLAVMGVGFRRLWKDFPAQRSLYLGMGLFCAFYFVVHVFWHVSARRYVIPLLPFMLMFLVHGANVLCTPLKNRKMWMSAAVGLLLIPYTYKNALAVYESLVAPNPMKSPPWQSLAWLNQHTPSDTQILSDIATNVELYTDRQAVVEVAASNSETFLYRLTQERLSYIVYRHLFFVTPGVSGSGNPNLVWVRMSEWIDRHPDRFPLAFAGAAEQTDVFRVVPEQGFLEAYEKINEATHYYDAGRYDEAFRLTKRSIGIDPQLGTAFNLLGAIYVRRNDPVNAEQAWLHAAKLLPDSPNAWVNLATLYQMVGRTERVPDYLRKAKEVADQSGLQDVYQDNMRNRQQEWDQHRAMLFVDPLTFARGHSPTVGK